jgi:hypothetical protein
VDEPAPPRSFLEAARSDATGLRHVLVPLASVLEARGRSPDGVAAVTLPEGGSLRVRVEGLPDRARPSGVTVAVFPPFGPWLELFREASVLPMTDGGLVECGVVPRAYAVPFAADGSAVLAHVPADHAVAVTFADTPEAGFSYLVDSSSSTGPTLEAVEGDVLRVPEGSEVTYVVRWKERPTARVRVGAADGSPVVGARVAFGFRPKDGRARLFDQGLATGPDGVAIAPLWSGPRIPDWTPATIVFAVAAPGHRARVVEAEGRWYGAEAVATLEPSSPGSFTVAGTLRLPNDRPAAGIPVRVSAADPFGGEAAFEALVATTDADGAWSVSVREDLRPLFEYAGGLRVRVDGERLEAQPAGAFWRAAWSGLPRASVEPDAVALPAPRGTATHGGRLAIPE